MDAISWQTAMFLSPHSDDAAFSAAGALNWLVNAQKTKCDIQVAMSCSDFQTGKSAVNRQTEITQVRQAEDRQFARLFGADKVTVNWLGFNDAPLRGYTAKGDYQSGKPLIAYDLELAWAIAESVAPDLQAGSVVFAPLAIGRHIDHRIVRTAALALKSALDIELLLFEDMPYSTNYEPLAVADAVQRLAHAYGFELQPLLTTTDDLIEFKHEALECYPSQRVAGEFEAILDYATKLTDDGKAGAERLWRVAFTGTKTEIVA